MTFGDVASYIERGLAQAFGFDVLSVALVLLLATAWLALRGMRAASIARLARAEAEARLSAAEALASEMRGLRAQIEEAVRQHNAAITSAVLQHNEACARTAMTPDQGEGEPHDEGEGEGERDDRHDHHDDESDDGHRHQEPSMSAGDDDHHDGAEGEDTRHDAPVGDGGHPEDDKPQAGAFLKAFFGRRR